jgi:hypothetical protein
MKYLCYIICALFIVVGGILLIFGFSSLEATELGLDYSWVTKNVDSTIYQNGLHFLGIGHSFVKYPKMVQTIEFSNDRGADLKSLQSRTQDGLEVVIEVSFQYQIDSSKLFPLFNAYGEQYKEVFQNIAADILTEESTKFTAYQFFNNKAMITNDFKDKLNIQYQLECFSSVIFLQLRKVDLPNPFEEAIRETEVKKQDINIAKAEQKKVLVEVDTLIKSALFQKNVTINIAEGDAQSILQNNDAQVDSYNKVQTAQTNAYMNLKNNLAMKNEDLLKMIKTQVVRDYAGNNMAVAVNSPEPAVPK